MARPRARAAGIGLSSLLLGWAFLVAMTGRTATEFQPYVETVGFALSTPAGLALLTYLTGVFRFGDYYGERGVPGLFGDFFFSVLAATAAGLAVTAAVGGLTDSSTVVFVVAAFATFLGAFGSFLVRARGFFDWEAPTED